MQRIYEAANNVEAHMIVHMLDSAGIQAFIQGEHLQSGAGELPLGGLVAVAVADDDSDAALRIIREWEARTRTPSEPSVTTAASKGFYGQLIAVVIGGLFGSGIVWSIHHGPDAAEGVRDWNDDGEIDERAYYDGSVLDRIELDRNFDGKIDAIERYDLQGWIRRFETDDDFDGRLESVITYRDRQPLEWRIDVDGDGATDYLTTYKFGVAETLDYFDRSGGRVKRIRYTGPKLERAELDIDADGEWEKSYRFDRYDEPVDVRTIAE